MAYTPHRTARFDHLGDLFEYMEQGQCATCPFRKQEADAEGPMCYELEGQALLEEPIQEWDEVSPDEIICRRKAAA